MIFKLFILLIALSNVHSTPVNVVEEKLISSDIISNKETVQNAPIAQIKPTQPELIIEKKLVRLARDNKIEYVYLNADGDVISRQNVVLPPKNLQESPNYTLNGKDAVERTMPREKEVMIKRNVDSTGEDLKLDEKESGALHYASGVKVHGENRRLGSALPSNAGMSASPQTGQYTNDANLFSMQNSLLPSYSPSISYPSIYPYLNSGLMAPLYTQSIVPAFESSLSSRVLPSLSSLYINPFASYLLPQQTSNLNYLLGRADLSGINGAFGAFPISYIIPQYPQVGQFGNSMVAQSILPANQEFVTRRVLLPPPSPVAEAPATNTALPFSDSTTASIVVPGVYNEGDKVNSAEKSMFYSNQNAALRMPYDTSLLSASYPGRVVDPNIPIARYPITPLSSRYNYYPQYSLSSMYRPTPMINSPYYPAVYPAVYGPYNGVGYVSSMHYSADPLTPKSEIDSKPIVSKEPLSKEANLMYTIKTLKSESKETVSRLDHNSENKINDDKA